MLDTYAALLVSFFIIKVGLDVIRDSLREFTDTAPSPEIVAHIGECILKTDGVLDMHDLRVRTAGGRYQMETHIEVDGRLTVFDGHRISKEVEGCLLEEIPDMDRVIIPRGPQASGGDGMRTWAGDTRKALPGILRMGDGMKGAGHPVIPG